MKNRTLARYFCLIVSTLLVFESNANSAFAQSEYIQSSSPHGDTSAMKTVLELVLNSIPANTPPKYSAMAVLPASD
jgi:hypothetical protein